MVSPLTGNDQRPVSQARPGRELGLKVPHRVWWLTPPPISASSLGEVLAAIRPWISKHLLDGPGWERMLAVARGLPADAANYQFGFEYQLQHPSADADLCIAVWPRTPVARHFVSRGKAPDAGLAEAAFADVLLEIERDGSFLSRVLGGAIVEYDLSTGPGPRSPGIFLACPRFWDCGNRGHTNPGLLTAALAAAAARPERDEERRAVEKLFDALPAGARILHAGAFPGRRKRAVRLLVTGVEAAELPRMLERAGWPGSAGAVASAVSGYCDLTPCVAAAIDVGPNGVSPRLGLEMFQSPDRIRRLECSEEVWHRFIDRLVERSLCLFGKAVGLRDAARAEVVSDPASGMQANKGINHFKIVLHGDHVEAKAYVFFSARPRLTTTDLLRILG